MTIDELWLEVKSFYEKSYRKKNGLPFRFHERPSDEKIEFLAAKMRQLGLELGRFYQKDIGLLHKLEYMEGLSHKEDPVKKRKVFE